MADGSADTLRLPELPKPVPEPAKLRVRVHATPVTAGGVEVRGLRLPWPDATPIRIRLGLRRRKPNLVPVVLADAGESVADLIFLQALPESDEPETVTVRRSPLEEVAEAHRSVGTGPKQGHLVLVVAGEG